MTTVKVFAPAKINLTLHITGQRLNGYHALDSLVTFATVGDSLTLNYSDAFSLTVEGPEASGVPTDMDNLALKAAQLAGARRKASITLAKNLPASSGIGGGSSDAAAAWRGMIALGNTSDPQNDPPDIALTSQVRAMTKLGADVPMCMAAQPLRATGIGDEIALQKLPTLYAVLANPRVPVSTPEVFAALTSKTNPPMPVTLPDFADAGALIAWLGTQRNDLQAPAIQIAPQIGDVLTRLAELKNVGLSRMSGSGATCFALFDQIEDARHAAETLYHERSDWWVAGCVLQDMFAASVPH